MGDYLIDVDPTGYVDAGVATRDLIRILSSSSSALLSSLAGSGGMAGSDDAGQTWATSYDEAARSVTTDTGSLLTAIDSLAVGLHVTGYNHALAEAHASNGRAGSDVAAPATPSTISIGSPPSSHGGNRDFPWGFDYVADLIGMAWPDGDTGKLRSAGSAWESYAGALDGIDTTGPLSHVSGFSSPEIPSIEQKMQSVRTVVDGLANQARAIATGCRARADAIEKARNDTTAELVKLAAMIAGTVAASALLTPLTLGISDAVGAGAVTAETATSVGRIVVWLTEAVESTITAAGVVAETVTGVGGLSVAIEALAVRIAPMAAGYVLQGVVASTSGAVVDGAVYGSEANIGEDLLWGMLLPGGGAVAAGTRRVGEKVVVESAVDSSRGSAAASRTLTAEEKEALRGIDRGDGRDVFGHYTGADTLSKNKEALGLQQYAEIYGKTPISDQVLAKSENFVQGRRYDGLVQNADLSYTGVEVKSGNAMSKYRSATNPQRLFDESVSLDHPATAILHGKRITITSVKVIEVP
ncbi:hypothetical protein [Frondihabitans sp. 4ASC-45]|jgi:hypothetical protein|uniref:WXG100-like domain-containing protein n=1 Tax=Frondihabitans sp. 4ASC-45 TaxID=3111636 RepID=UPI003C2EA6E3